MYFNFILIWLMLTNYLFGLCAVCVKYFPYLQPNGALHYMKMTFGKTFAILPAD